MEEVAFLDLDEHGILGYLIGLLGQDCFVD